MAFEKDLGYLDKFFDKIEAHGREVGGAAGDRLVELMTQDRALWAEVKSLLGGGAPTKSAPAPEAAKGSADEKAAPSPAPDVGESTDTTPLTLTVGSLRGGE